MFMRPGPWGRLVGAAGAMTAGSLNGKPAYASERPRPLANAPARASPNELPRAMDCTVDCGIWL